MFLIRIARYVWAAPCSMVGLLAATLAFVFGGSVRGKRGVLEVSLAAGMPRALPGLKLTFEAITLGHVIIGRTEQGLERLRLHELEHVRQYEQWGLLFFLAYPLSSLWQLMQGRNPYWDNYFEIQARERSAMKALDPDDHCG